MDTELFSDVELQVLHGLHAVPAAEAARRPHWSAVQRLYLLRMNETPCVHVAVEIMNAQTAAARETLWGKCQNCGQAFRQTEQVSGLFCSDDCETEAIADLYRDR